MRSVDLIMGSCEPVRELAMQVYSRRVALGLSVRDAAEMAGVDKSVFNRAERAVGDGGPRLANSVPLLRWLDESEPMLHGVVVFDPVDQFS